MLAPMLENDFPRSSSGPHVRVRHALSPMQSATVASDSWGGRMHSVEHTPIEVCRMLSGVRSWGTEDKALRSKYAERESQITCLAVRWGRWDGSG